MSQGSLKVIDLFAGVGGISLGAARAGFTISAAVELDKHAVQYHGINFPNCKHLTEDIAALTGQRLLELSGVRRNQLTGLVGGPPCQGFSSIGLRRRKDPRNQLLVHFFQLVAETRPAFFVAENVPGLIQLRNKTLLERALSYVPSDYILLGPIICRASDYGVPTIRTRVFFIGYDPGRVGALSTNDFLPKGVQDVRVRQALSGLPAIRSTWQSEKQSWRIVSSLSESHYERRIKGCVPRDVGDPTALSVYQTQHLVSGFFGTAHAVDVIQRFDALKPGESDAISKCVRLDAGGYCPTLRAGTGPERGGFQAIRPVHPTSPRVISPREAARLQGFPDWFQFHPTKWHAFRQIGNSVSPIVSEALMTPIYRAMS